MSNTEAAPTATATDATMPLPDLFFGGVSAVGTPLDLAFNTLVSNLAKRSYVAEPIQLSEMPRLLATPTPEAAPGSGAFKRTWALMDRGNEARELSQVNDVLASLAIGIANAHRLRRGSVSTGFAPVFRQLKRPEEAYLLRRVYDVGFHLIGVYSPRSARLARLQTEKGMTADEAQRLVERDEFEDEPFGQFVRNTFHLADVFIRVTGGQEDLTAVPEQVGRFFNLLFGDGIHTPTKDEYGMFLAWAAGLRSAQLSRQVGAAILSGAGEVLGLGTNEVPQGGGGQYWEGESGADGRDHAFTKRDSTDAMREEMLSEILEVLEPSWNDADPNSREALLAKRQDELRHTRLMNLTEFTRAVHAEMEAIASAVRVGVSVNGATLYTTAFPCHNCTKHIVAAGISRVVFIEPYPKSLARELHSDSIQIEGEDPDPSSASFGNRIPFQPFVGIAPRRYASFFQMTDSEGWSIRRKDSKGVPLANAAGLRLKLRPDSYLDREVTIAKTNLDLTSSS